MRGREGQVWRIVPSGFWRNENDLHLVVIDDGREMDGQRFVIMLDLHTGELDHELEKWLQAGLDVGWERVT